MIWAEVNMVHSPKSLWRPAKEMKSELESEVRNGKFAVPFWGFMAKDAHPLCIASTNFKRELLTRTENQVCRPNLNIHAIYLTWNDRLHIR